MARPTLAQIAAGLDVDAKSDPEDLLAILVAGTNPDGTPLTPEGRDTAAEPGTSVAIGNVSTPVVAANPDRAELTLVNDSADPIYLVTVHPSTIAAGAGVRE